MGVNLENALETLRAHEAELRLRDIIDNVDAIHAFYR